MKKLPYLAIAALMAFECSPAAGAKRITIDPQTESQLLINGRDRGEGRHKMSAIMEGVPAASIVVPEQIKLASGYYGTFVLDQQVLLRAMSRALFAQTGLRPDGSKPSSMAFSLELHSYEWKAKMNGSVLESAKKWWFSVEGRAVATLTFNGHRCTIGVKRSSSPSSPAYQDAVVLLISDLLAIAGEIIRQCVNQELQKAGEPESMDRERRVLWVAKIYQNPDSFDLHHIYLGEKQDYSTTKLRSNEIIKFNSGLRGVDAVAIGRSLEIRSNHPMIEQLGIVPGDVLEIDSVEELSASIASGLPIGIKRNGQSGTIWPSSGAVEVGSEIHCCVFKLGRIEGHGYSMTADGTTMWGNFSDHSDSRIVVSADGAVQRTVTTISGFVANVTIRNDGGLNLSAQIELHGEPVEVSANLDATGSLQLSDAVILDRIATERVQETDATEIRKSEQDLQEAITAAKNAADNMDASAASLAARFEATYGSCSCVWNICFNWGYEDEQRCKVRLGSNYNLIKAIGERDHAFFPDAVIGTAVIYSGAASADELAQFSGVVSVSNRNLSSEIRMGYLLLAALKHGLLSESTMQSDALKFQQARAWSLLSDSDKQSEIARLRSLRESLLLEQARTREERIDNERKELLQRAREYLQLEIDALSNRCVEGDSCACIGEAHARQRAGQIEASRRDPSKALTICGA